MAQSFYETLINQDKTIGERYQAVFELKNLANIEAIELLKKAYPFCG